MNKNLGTQWVMVSLLVTTCSVNAGGRFSIPEVPTYEQVAARPEMKEIAEKLEAQAVVERAKLQAEAQKNRQLCHELVLSQQERQKRTTEQK